jgi:hypothetical protein
VQVPPPQFEKADAKPDGSAFAFFWDAVLRVQEGDPPEILVRSIWRFIWYAVLIREFFPLCVQRTKAWMGTFRTGSGWINPSTSGRSTTITRAMERLLTLLSNSRILVFWYCYAQLVVLSLSENWIGRPICADLGLSE